MDWSYWESNSAAKFSQDQYHDTIHVNNPLYNSGAQTWPDEDQTHHLAVFFAAGVLLGNLDISLRRALRGSEDYPANRNPGDFNLGVVGWDIGLLYIANPTYISNTVVKRLMEPAMPRPGYSGATAYGDAGRSTTTP